MIEAVLFEFDGVLADTRDARRRALLDTLEEDGVTIDDAKYAEWCASLPVSAAVRTALARSGVHADDTRVDLTAVRADRKFRTLV